LFDVALLYVLKATLGLAVHGLDNSHAGGDTHGSVDGFESSIPVVDNLILEIFGSGLDGFDDF
ncbi:unnamed protein product, partial [Clonostachys chloroleuca]